MTIDDTHHPALASWVPGADEHADFPVQNLPLGIGALPGGQTGAVVAVGDHVVDLAALSEAGLLPRDAFLSGSSLNYLFSLSSSVRRNLRRRLSALLSSDEHRAQVEPHLHSAANVEMTLPCAIGDYTDFYVGIHHAENIGRQFRPDQPLLPNYKWVPIGYHGRASSVRPSGVPVRRPRGQRKPPDSDAPVFGPSQRLDYELELGVWIGPGNAPGEAIPISEAARHVAGLSLLNDWSARDLQAWEYQPLGPFLAKNFATSISPWVVTAEALAPFRTAQPPRAVGDPAPLPYLWNEDDQAMGALAIELEVHLSSAAMRDAGHEAVRLSRGPATNMYWTVQQIVTHHASNGCDLRPGDLLGTGTISAPTRDGYGSLLEISAGGREPVTLPTGETRAFLADGDEVVMTATARADGYRSIGFGECRATISACA